MKYHHGDLRNALIAAALAWLDEQGQLPSLRALSVACGVSHGAPYRHFADAEDLRGAVAAACFRALGEATPPGDPGAEPFDALIRGCRAYIEWGLAHPARYALMFGLRSPVTAHPECGQAALSSFGNLIAAMGACGSPDPGRSAVTAWAALHGAVELGRHGLAPPVAGGASLTDDVLAMIRRWAASAP